jgi:hypothetical protein
MDKVADGLEWKGMGRTCVKKGNTARDTSKNEGPAARKGDGA